MTGSIIPDTFAYYWAPPAPMYDPAKAKQLLAAAGYPNGFDAGDYFCDSSFACNKFPSLHEIAPIEAE